MANPPLQKQFGALPEVGAASDAALQTTKMPTGFGADNPMTIGGTSGKTAFLLILVLGAGAWGWTLVEPQTGNSSLPGWWFFLAIAVLGLAILTAFKPQLAIITGPLYALTQGVAIGTISRLYESQFEGIVLQAIMATAAVFSVMLVLFVTGAIKVTAKFRGIVVGATLGIVVFYLATFVFSLFGVEDQQHPEQPIR